MDHREARIAKREQEHALPGNQHVSIAWYCPAHKEDRKSLFVAYRSTYEGAPSEWWSERHRIESRSVAEDAVASSDDRRNVHFACGRCGVQMATLRRDTIQRWLDRLYDAAVAEAGIGATRRVEIPAQQ